MVDTMTDLPGVRFSWIGLDDIAVEGTFRWITREPLSFNLMAPSVRYRESRCPLISWRLMEPT